MSAAEIAETGERTVVIAEGIRCVDEDGQVHANGATATVPAALAQDWIRNGWATEPAAKAEAK